jgi:3-methyl-2-oxobutanoate hydroxymethyltransferase
MKIRTATLAKFKAEGKKFAALTSYDKNTAAIFDDAGIAVLLVGDSASDNVLGNRDTLAIGLDEMIWFGRAVASAAKNALVVVDMPFGSYEASAELALESATRIMKETGAQAVKLEGGTNRAAQIAKIVDAGIPVMAHLGFTPQSVHALGGFKVQGRGEGAEKLRDDLRAVSEAGAFAVVFELVPAELAGELTHESAIPTIGIGAGRQTDGQILVWQDFAGLNEKTPSFAAPFLNLRAELAAAATSYREQIEAGEFPPSSADF